MRLIPALDLRDGRCVRLLKGDFSQETRYPVDPLELAERYRELGADWLHVVDLDGAASGRPMNLAVVRELARIEGLRIQLGGGIRDRATLEQALEVADRIVIGSLAISDAAQVASWLDSFTPERITLGFDVRLGADAIPYVTTHGWTEATTTTLDAAVARYSSFGLRHVLCTDVDRDGALAGPNFELYRSCVKRWPGLALQASGGVRDSGDLETLAETGVAAAISGKALLEDRMSDREIRRFLPNA